MLVPPVRQPCLPPVSERHRRRAELGRPTGLQPAHAVGGPFRRAAWRETRRNCRGADRLRHHGRSIHPILRTSYSGIRA